MKRRRPVTVAAFAAWRWYESNGFIDQGTGDTKRLLLFPYAPHLYHPGCR